MRRATITTGSPTPNLLEKMKNILLLITILILLLPLPVFASNVPEEPVGSVNDPEPAQSGPAGNDPAAAEALSDLYAVVDELRSELAERDETEPPAERPTQPETTADRSAPRLMATDYQLDTGFLSPGKQGKLTVVLTNTNQKRAVANLKLTLTDDTGDLLQEGMNTRYVGALGAGRAYTLEVVLSARHNAAVGRHSLTLTADYEDGDFQSYSSSDTLYVDVRQTAELSFSGAELPARVVEGDTVTVTLTLMNTGKAQLSNCKADLDVKGLPGVGTAFGGDLAPGESKTVSANLRAQPEKPGAVKGTVTVTYEDEYGQTYTKTAEVSTVIEKKVEVAAAPAQEQKKALPWWLYGGAGLLLGCGAAFGVTYAVFAAKQRKQDELRL